MIAFTTFAKLDGDPVFLPRSVFTPYADLDGKAAAEFLQANGAESVAHRDISTNGLAVGQLSDGSFISLSTNGCLTICSGLTARTFDWWFRATNQPISVQA